jgi:hypothetical protein
VKVPEPHSGACAAGADLLQCRLPGEVVEAKIDIGSIYHSVTETQVKFRRPIITVPMTASMA